MKVLLLGKNGMLGSEIAKLLEETDFELMLTGKQELDITDETQIKRMIFKKKPDLIINCAAYTEVDNAESNQMLANLLNGEAVGWIAEACAENGSALIHFSTDYIFNGAKKGGYVEHDGPTPINAYGNSKLLGERKIQANMNPKKFIIIRTSWIYGKGGINFVDTMVKLAKSQKEGTGKDIYVVKDQFGKPSYAPDLAKSVMKVIRTFKNEELKFRNNILHITNEGNCSWYDFAKEIFRILEWKIRVIPTTSAEFSRPAQRPHYSILNSTRFPKLRSWKEALREYLKGKSE